MDSFLLFFFFFFFQAEDGIRDWSVTGVQTCALPIAGEGIERMRGGVDQTELALLQRREGPAPALLQPVRQELQRAEWRPHVVHELDEKLDAVGPYQRGAGQLLKAPLDGRAYVPQPV